MSESREPSYYEIALTSRQAFTAFVLLLVCLLAAFFAGLWVGRGAMLEATTASLEGPSAVTGGEEEPVEELKFFSEADEPVAASGEAPEEPRLQPAAREEETLLEQLAAQDTGTAGPRAEDRPPPRRRTPKAGRTAPPPAPVPETASTPAPKPKPEPRESPPPSASQPAPAAGAPPVEGDVVIQVFSSADQAQASRVLERLRGDGYAAYVEPVQENGQTLFRVRIGPFASKEAAEPVAATVRSKHHLDTWITRVGS